MEKRVIGLVFYLLHIIYVQAQDTLNLNFEQVNSNKMPVNWDTEFKQRGASGYHLSLDSLIRQEGKYSLKMINDVNASYKTFGACSYTIPAKYEGSTITLKGYMKTESVKNGFAGLWLRIDGEEGVLKFNNMQKENIKGTNDWKEYIIELELPAEAKNIAFGGKLSGEGIIWVDNYQLLIDGKELNMARLKKETNDNRKYKESSTVSSIELSETTINQLVILGKVWGFLKYYHPAIAKGKYNWDYELFNVMPKVLNAKSELEFTSTLCSWVDSLGKFETAKEKSDNNEIVKQKPDLSWINKSTLGDSLTLNLNNVRNAKRENESYYIGLEEGVGNPKFKNEKSYNSIKYPDAGFRLLCLYRYWNMIQYYFPYKNLIGEDWNVVLKEFIPLYVNASNELEYKLATLKLIARIHDTHATIGGFDCTLEAYKGEYFAPLEISFVENKAVVTDYYDQTLGESTGLKKGDVIESINNKSIEEIIREKLPYTSASNYPRQLRNIALELLRGNDTVITVTWRRAENKHTSKIKCYGKEKFNIYKNYFKTDTCFRILPSGIAYIFPGSIKNKYLQSIMPKVLKTKGLIIDMRCYPSEFIVFTLSDYLQPKKIGFVKFSVGSVTTPGLFTMSHSLEVGRRNKHAYNGKVVIIVDGSTLSNAEYTALALRTVPGSIVIGSTTAGADGDVSKIILPGGILTAISGIGVYYPDGKETQRIGIRPDREVNPTIKGIADGKDELLEKAVEIINATCQ